jgi:glycogen(starch) synthase
MRIAMLVRSFSTNGGLELYTHKLVEGLLDRGHAVTVVCEDDSSELKHENLTVRTFPPAPSGSRKSVRILNQAKNASATALAAGTFDIIHSQHLPCTVANVVTFHNHTAGRMSQVGLLWEQLLIRTKLALIQAYKLRDHYDRLLCLTASCLIFPAQVCRDDFYTTYGITTANPRATAAIAYPGAMMTAMSGARALEGDASKPFTFLFVGKGFRKKGLDILLQACGILKQRGKRFRLHIAGLKEKPIDAARLSLMGLKECVFYLGFRSDMDRVYAEASAVVLPSRIEPFGMAPLQGALAGLVPIVSRVCGAAEVLTDGEDGLILQNHLDPAELADLMQRLIDGPELAQKLSAAARITAATITWEGTVQSTLAAYESAIAILKS